MALTTEPTDADILDAADDFRSQYKHGGTTFDEFDALGFARAALRSWGQPSGAGEAAEHYRNAIASACEGWTMPAGLRKHLETALWSLPTQAQAGAVPLTDEQIDRAIAELGLNYLADAHATNRAMLRKLCHHANGIRGGQHGST